MNPTKEPYNSTGWWRPIGCLAMRCRSCEAGFFLETEALMIGLFCGNDVWRYGIMHAICLRHPLFICCTLYVHQNFVTVRGKRINGKKVIIVVNQVIELKPTCLLFVFRWARQNFRRIIAEIRAVWEIPSRFKMRPSRLWYGKQIERIAYAYEYLCVHISQDAGRPKINVTYVVLHFPGDVITHTG